MWEKRATSAEGNKTIRIAESSDMDSWEAVLRPCARFYKTLSFEKKIKWKKLHTCTHELVQGRGVNWTMIEIWSLEGGVWRSN